LTGKSQLFQEAEPKVPKYIYRLVESLRNVFCVKGKLFYPLYKRRA